MEIFHKPNIDFIGLRWYPIGASLLVVVVGLAAIGIKGFNYSIEFTGGSLIQVSFPAGSKTNVDHVRKALEKEHLDAEVQSVESDHPTFILREKSTEDEAAVKIFADRTLDVL